MADLFGKVAGSSEPQLPQAEADTSVTLRLNAANFLTGGGELSIAKYLSGAKALPAFLIANGDADPLVTSAHAQRLHDALKAAGATSTLTIIRGAGHEDPAFMATQMLPTFAFLDKTLGL